MFMLGAAAASALLGVVAIGLWTRMLATSGRTSRRAELAADQLESTAMQLKEFMERSAAESLSHSAGTDSHQDPAGPGLQDRSEGPERTGEDRLKELIHQRRVSRLAQVVERLDSQTFSNS